MNRLGHRAVQDARHHRHPNCSTIPDAGRAQRSYDAVGIERINVLHLPVGVRHGKESIEELAGADPRAAEFPGSATKVYPKQIAFNVLPHIDVFQDNGYTKEE